MFLLLGLRLKFQWRKICLPHISSKEIEVFFNYQNLIKPIFISVICVDIGSVSINGLLAFLVCFQYRINYFKFPKIFWMWSPYVTKICMKIKISYYNVVKNIIWWNKGNKIIRTIPLKQNILKICIFCRNTVNVKSVTYFKSIQI